MQLDIYEQVLFTSDFISKNNHLYTFTPVSYTHLDVYKRQV